MDLQEELVLYTTWQVTAMGVTFECTAAELEVDERWHVTSCGRLVRIVLVSVEWPTLSGFRIFCGFNLCKLT
jgi:hypothetical protein